MFIEWKKNGKPGLVGIVTGTIAGLVTITPASGSVGPIGAIIIGFSAGVICYYMCGIVKGALKIDDSLDVFAVHDGVGGILGTLLVAFLAAAQFGGNAGVDFNTLAQLWCKLLASLSSSGRASPPSSSSPFVKHSPVYA